MTKPKKPWPPVLAHRYAWELTNGAVPEGLHVLHKCDGGPIGCVRPDHLFLGTNDDNIADRMAKGRSANGPRRCGELNAQQADDVARLLAAGHEAGHVALAYAVPVTVIEAARREPVSEEAACG